MAAMNDISHVPSSVRGPAQACTGTGGESVWSLSVWHLRGVRRVAQCCICTLHELGAASELRLAGCILATAVGTYSEYNVQGWARELYELSCVV